MAVETFKPSFLKIAKIKNTQKKLMCSTSGFDETFNWTNISNLIIVFLIGVRKALKRES